MLKRTLEHLSANPIAYLALLFALGGTSYAAASALVPPNSVGTKQVINHSLRKIDFKAGQLPRGPRGFRGDPGIPGPLAPQGLPALPGLAESKGLPAPST